MSGWEDLPKELLETISKRLDSGVDVLRFRAVCTSWRYSASLPSFDQEIPPLILKLPAPISSAAVLLKTKICCMKVVLNDLNLSCSSSKSWLVKVGVSKFGRLQLLHPLTNYEFKYSPISLNLLDFKFVELSKAFSLRRPNRFSILGINKVVLFPSNPEDDFGILAIYHEGKLGYWRFGDKEWTLVDERNFEYDDIIEHKGQCYVVDRWGTVSWIDSSLKVIQYSPPLYGCGGQKTLVESFGALYVVDRYLDGERKTWKDYENVPNNNNPVRIRKHIIGGPKVVDFRIHKLDEDWGSWVDVKSLDDRVFILGMDCSFSVSCREFDGGKGNCIYYTDGEEYVGRGPSLGSIHVFQLEDHSIEKLGVIPEFSDIFWPPNVGSSA